MLKIYNKFILILFISGIYSNVFADNNKIQSRSDNTNNLVNKVVNKDIAHRSLMFNDTEMDWLNNAVKSRDNNIPIGILLPNLFPNETIQKEVNKTQDGDKKTLAPDNSILANSYPKAINLNSIVYSSDGNWIVWLGDKKISSNNNDDISDNKHKMDYLKVYAVAKDRAVIVWNKFPLELLTPSWKVQLSRIDEGEFYTNNINLVLDSKSGNMAFLLRVNQSLLSREFKVVEGKQAIVTKVDVKDMAKGKLDSKADTKLDESKNNNDNKDELKNSKDNLENGKVEIDIVQEKEKNDKLFNENKKQLSILKKVLQEQ